MSNNTTVLVVPGPKVVTVLGIPSVYTGPISPTRGGTGLSSYVIGDLLYASASNALAALAGNTTATRQFLTSTGTGSAAQAPAWAALAASDIPAGIDAAKIGGGTISSAEFACLEGATSPLQAQLDTATTGAAAQFSAIGTSLNNKSDAGHTHDAAAIVTGTVAPVRLGSGTPTSSTLLDGSGAWRPLTGSDIPQHSAALLNSGTLDVARLNGGNSTQFVRADGTNSNTLTGRLTCTGLDLGPVGTILGSGTNSFVYISGGNGGQQSNGAISQWNGNTQASAPGNAFHYTGSDPNARHVWYDYLSAQIFNAGPNGITMAAKPINLGNTATVPATNSIAGTSLGPVINAGSGLYLRVQTAGSNVMQFDPLAITAFAPLAMQGNYLQFANTGTSTYDTTSPSITGGATGLLLNTHSATGIRAVVAGTVNSNFGASFGIAGATRFAIGPYAVGAASNTNPGIACDGSHLLHNVASGFAHYFSHAGNTTLHLPSTGPNWYTAVSSDWASNCYSNNIYNTINLRTTAIAPGGAAIQGTLLSYAGNGLYIYGFPNLVLFSTAGEGIRLSDSTIQCARNLSFTSGFGIPEEVIRSFATGGPNLANISLKQLRSSQNILPNSNIAGTAVQTRVTGIAGVPGGTVYSYTGSGSATVYLCDSLIPVDPTKTYSLRAWAANTVNNPDTYMGVYCYNSAGAGIGWVFVVNGVKPPSGGQWYQGYCSGTGANGVSQFPANTSYIRMGYLTGYGSPVGSWTTQISPIEFIECPAQCGAFHNATQSLADTTWTAASFNSEILDTSNLHDTATNTDRVNVPRTGKYRITAQAEFAANATGYRQARITINGTALARSTKIVPNNGAILEAQAGIEIYALLTAGDIVRLEAYQDSGGSLNLTSNTRLHLLWISD